MFQKEKKIISLISFELERFALHFHKCPHLSSLGTPTNQIQLEYFYPLDPIEVSKLVFVHPVVVLYI